jgi:hypothetical protein
MLRTPDFRLASSSIILLSVLLAGCNSPAYAVNAPVVITVKETVPVEVTRQVEVTHLVEVTRQVVVTRLVEVLVTPTPLANTETSTPTILFQPLTPLPTLLSTAKIGDNTTPKSPASVPFFIENQTDSPLLLNLSGPQTLLTLTLGPDEVRKTYLAEADYTYEVWRDGQIAYAGKFTINNFDKHGFFMRQNKAVLWIP